jgi:ribosomal subunit interface protein
MSQQGQNPADAVRVEVSGAPTERAQRYAAEKIGALARYAPRPVRHAHVTIDAPRADSSHCSVRAKALLDVDGRTLHASSSADTVYEAVDLLRHRLLAQLSRQRRPLRARAYAWFSRPVHRA